jgi:hypothetical protein
MKSRRNVRNMRKNRKTQKGRGFFTEKTLQDNKRNCRNYYHSINRRNMLYECDDEKILKSRMFPGMMNRMMGNKVGSEIGTSTLGM